MIIFIVRSARRIYSLAWAVALGLLLGGAMGNLTDRIFRSPGPFRGWVVDWIQVPHWPVFNLADSAIVCGGVLMVLLAARGHRLDGTAAARSRRGPGGPAAQPDQALAGAPLGRRQRMTPPGQRRVPVPDGLDGERLDAALARLFGLSRARAAELISDGSVLVGGRPGGQVRPGARRGVAGRHAAAAGDGAAASRARARAGRGVRGRRHPGRGQAARRRRAPDPGLDRADRAAGPAGRRSHDRHQRRGRAPGHRAPAGRQHLRA